MAIIRSGFIFLFLYQNVMTYDSNNCSTIPSELPIFPPENPQMHFYLFTNNNFDIEKEIFTGNKDSLNNSKLNKDWPLRILVHGWSNFGLCCLNAYVKDAYLQKGNFNVIIVDWWDWSQNQLYFPIIPLIFGEIGQKLANFTKFLNQDGKIPFDNMYLIGHSLGAHISGAAGEFIKPDKFNTIFGLDPAGIGFQGNSPNKRLDSSQATYVEQITTNANFAGYDGLIGHSAFYPNYGRFQVLCLGANMLSPSCSHNAGYYYFAESINTKTGFCAAPCPYFQPHCDQKILMGGEPSIQKSGEFCLLTNIDKPYATCNC